MGVFGKWLAFLYSCVGLIISFSTFEEQLLWAKGRGVKWMFLDAGMLFIERRRLVQGLKTDFIKRGWSLDERFSRAVEKRYRSALLHLHRRIMDEMGADFVLWIVLDGRHRPLAKFWTWWKRYWSGVDEGTRKPAHEGAFSSTTWYPKGGFARGGIITAQGEADRLIWNLIRQGTHGQGIPLGRNRFLRLAPEEGAILTTDSDHGMQTDTTMVGTILSRDARRSQKEMSYTGLAKEVMEKLLGLDLMQQLILNCLLGHDYCIGLGLTAEEIFGDPELRRLLRLPLDDIEGAVGDLMLEPKRTTWDGIQRRAKGSPKNSPTQWELLRARLQAGSFTRDMKRSINTIMDQDHASFDTTNPPQPPKELRDQVFSGWSSSGLLFEEEPRQSDWLKGWRELKKK